MNNWYSHSNIFSLLFTALCFLTGCNHVHMPLPPVEIDLPEGQRVKTLSSLQKIDDYPLYVMHYYGDYGFDEFLTEGIDLDDKGNDVWRCTCFTALNEDGNMVYGRNFDWSHLPSLLLFTHPPNAYASVAMTPIEPCGYANRNPRLSTLEDRQNLLYAPYGPLDGMNECGLVVAELAVKGEYVFDPAKATLTNLQTTRLLLDYAKNVDEAIELLKQYNNIASKRVHYLIADAEGNSAIVQYSGGKVVATRNKDPWQVVTNTSVLSRKKEDLYQACNRYKYVDMALAEAGGNLSNDQAMQLLAKVSVNRAPVPGRGYHDTQWSIVYNMKTGEIQIAMDRKYGNTHSFKIKLKEN